jgi:hypothetical protein
MFLPFVLGSPIKRNSVRNGASNKIDVELTSVGASLRGCPVCLPGIKSNKKGAQGGGTPLQLLIPARTEE